MSKFINVWLLDAFSLLGPSVMAAGARAPWLLLPCGARKGDAYAGQIIAVVDLHLSVHAIWRALSEAVLAAADDAYGGLVGVHALSAPDSTYHRPVSTLCPRM